MPAYAVPTDANDLVLLSHHDQRKGQWIIIYQAAPTVKAVYGNYKSWRIANRTRNRINGDGNVYWSDGAQFWLAT